MIVHAIVNNNESKDALVLLKLQLFVFTSKLKSPQKYKIGYLALTMKVVHTQPIMTISVNVRLECLVQLFNDVVIVTWLYDIWYGNRIETVTRSMTF